MHSRESFCGYEAVNHTFDIGAALRAEVQAETAGCRMSLKKERQRLEANQTRPGLIDLFD
jgi:hypothetical protein